jgi:hypothetical protein
MIMFGFKGKALKTSSNRYIYGGGGSKSFSRIVKRVAEEKRIFTHPSIIILLAYKL